MEMLAVQPMIINTRKDFCYRQKAIYKAEHVPFMKTL